MLALLFCAAVPTYVIAEPIGKQLTFLSFLPDALNGKLVIVLFVVLK